MIIQPVAVVAGWILGRGVIAPVARLVHVIPCTPGKTAARSFSRGILEMEKYFITRYKPVHIPCHENESERRCSDFKPGGCAWAPHKKKGISLLCSQSNWLPTAIRNISVDFPKRSPQEPIKDCPFFHAAAVNIVFALTLHGLPKRRNPAMHAKKT